MSMRNCTAQVLDEYFFCAENEMLSLFKVERARFVSVSGRTPPLGHPGADGAPYRPARQEENFVLLRLWVEDQDIGVVAANMPYELTNSTIGADLLSLLFSI
jgi:hypothetical protein